MSKRIGVSSGAAFGVEDGPDRTGYVAEDVPVEGPVVTLPDGRNVKQIALAEFESVCTVRTLRADGTEVTDADPVVGHLSAEPVRQVRAAAPAERDAVWFVALPAEPAPDGDPNTASGDVLAALGTALSEAAPAGWQGLSVECEALGSRLSVAVTVAMADGTTRYWSPPAMVGQWLHRLRIRDYHPGRGVWFRARFELAPGAPLVRDVDSLTPPALLTDEDAADELRTLPRAATAVPRWLLDAAVRSEQAGRAGYAEEQAPAGPPELVLLFDGRDDAGRPTAYRPVLGERERQAVLAYLESAPLVLSSRGRTRDELSDSEEPAVPMGFHTDGRFVWPSATPYYLREHGVPPAPALVDHIRANRHRLPTVTAIGMDRAAALAAGRPWSAEEAAAAADQAMIPVEAVIIEKRISPRHYSVFAEREDAWCLVRDGDRYRVQWSLDRRGAVLFDDVRQAAAYLAGQLTVNAASLEFALGEEIPAWQSPLAVLSDDPPVSAFATVTTVEIENVEVDRYGGPEGNLVFVAGTPFEQRGLPADYARRPYHRYRIGGEPWRVVAVVSDQGGRGYVLPQSVDEYVRAGHLAEITPPSSHPGLPPITDAMRAEAARTPGGWVYIADPDVDPRFIAGMPLPVLLGGYKVGEDGQFTGETFVNEDYRPSPRRRGYPEPQTDFELVLGYVAAGWLPQDRMVPAMLDAPFLLETDGNDGLRVAEDDNGKRFLVVYSSPGYVPGGAQHIKQVEGRDLARVLAGVTLVVNPGGGFGIELPGDDLAQAVASAQPS